ncbi:Uncharacterised protein [uncultured archaeon]|nr:Uncharacterised protein [uncultured archaeon]
MGRFTNVYCPVCGANKPMSSFQKPGKKLPFGRIIESLGRSTLRTIQVITSPLKINLNPVKKRLLVAVRDWYDYGIIKNEDVDIYLVDLISSFNEWTRESRYEEMTFKGYVKTPATTYYQPESSNNIKNNSRRITKSWL